MFACTHGAGGGALPGGVINRNQRFADAFEGFDCLCTGHSHKPMTYAIMLLGTSGNVKVLPMPAYTFDPGVTKLSIDIGELIAGVILDIALPSGTITVKESK